MNLANSLREMGRTAEAEPLYEEALVIHREVGNRSSEGVALGRDSEARKAWQKGTTLLRETKDLRELERRRKAMREACRVAGCEPLPEATG